MDIAEKILKKFHSKGGHGQPEFQPWEEVRKIAVMGRPSVGKSDFPHRLTGAYVTISNYFHRGEGEEQ